MLRAFLDALCLLTQNTEQYKIKNKKHDSLSKYDTLPLLLKDLGAVLGLFRGIVSLISNNLKLSRLCL